MKNKKSKGLLLGVAMVASVASVGFASWVITSGGKGEATGNITAETVSEASITIESATFNASTIHYGHDKANADKAPAWLKANGGKESNLTTKLSFTVKGLSKGDTVVIGDVTEDTTSTYTAAVTAGVVSALPKGTTLTMGDAALTSSDGKTAAADGDGLTIEGDTATGFNVTFDYKFGWGEKFGTSSPEVFFENKAIDGTDTKDTTYTTWGAYANHYLSEVAKVNNAQFKVTITATPGK